MLYIWRIHTRINYISTFHIFMLHVCDTWIAPTIMVPTPLMIRYVLRFYVQLRINLAINPFFKINKSGNRRRNPIVQRNTSEFGAHLRHIDSMSNLCWCELRGVGFFRTDNQWILEKEESYLCTQIISGPLDSWMKWRNETIVCCSWPQNNREKNK